MAIPPSVVVRDGNGQPMSGVQVQFTVAEGGGALTGGTPSTNSQGISAVGSWTLGPNGTQRLRAQVGSLPPVTFDASITPGTEEFVASIGAGGGTFGIDDPENPFDGLTLSIPAGTFASSTEWRLRVNSQPSGIDLPTGFSIVGAALEISTNQARGARLMTLEVPAEAGPDRLTFLALYDPVRAVAELLPTVDRTDSTVVVVTSHLRGDLLLGPASGSAQALIPWLDLDGAARQSDGFEGVVLLTLEYQRQRLESLIDYAEALNRWPVVDHGTSAFPEGLGAGIAALQAAGSTGDYPSFADIVKELSIPGFYAEAGPLAAVQLTQELISQALEGVLPEFNSMFGHHSKPERDELIVQNVLANMELTGSPGFLAGIADQKAMAAAVLSGTSGGLTLLSPAASDPTEVTVSLGGFGTITLPLVAGGDSHAVSDVVPVSSFVLPIEQLRTTLSKLRQLTQALSPSARDAINEELAEEAGLPEVAFEIQHLAEAGWWPAALRPITARNSSTRIRILGSAITIHLPTGAEVFRAEGGAPVSLEDDLGLDLEAPLAVARRTIAMLSTALGGSARQASVAQVDMLLAPFEVEPNPVELDPGDPTVQLEASVPFPPDEGFRIEWNWGDGTTSENLGLTNASHEYDAPGNYTVVSTLKSGDGQVILATDTVTVTSSPGAWVGEVTLAMVAASGTWRFHTTELRLEPGPQIPGGRRWNVAEGETAFSFTESGIHACALSAPTEVRPVGTGWLEVLGNQVVGYRAAGSMNPWEVTLTADCGIHGSFDSVLTFDEWMGTKRDEAGAIVMEISEDPNLLEGSHFFESGGEGEGWDYTWRFERVWD